MELKYLQTFLTIVEEGGFTKAATKLNYTQSTITFQIKQLEKELSIALFEKIGRRMLLTKAGEQFIPYAKDVLLSLDKLQYFKDDLAEYQGDLHVGVGETLLCYKMPAVLKAFHHKAPKAKIFLQSMNCCDIRDGLIDGTLDLGIFYEDIGGLGTNLAIHHFGKYPCTLVAAPEVKKMYNDFKTSNQHIPLSLIINEKRCVFRVIFEEYLRQKSIRLDHTIELWSIPTIKNLVRSEVGVSFLPRFTVEEELDKGELIEIEMDMERPTISAVCGHHKNKWVSPLMELFMESLSK